jgi:hypothetical protein
MTYRDPATPAVWTYSAPLTAEEIAVNHRELIASYRPIYKREVLGMVIVGALLAVAAVPGSEGVALLVLVATAVTAVGYRLAVEPILRRRSAGGQPRPMTRSFELTEEASVRPSEARVTDEAKYEASSSAAKGRPSASAGTGSSPSRARRPDRRSSPARAARSSSLARASRRRFAPPSRSVGTPNTRRSRPAPSSIAASLPSPKVP